MDPGDPCLGMMNCRRADFSGVEVGSSAHLRPPITVIGLDAYIDPFPTYYETSVDYLFYIMLRFHFAFPRFCLGILQLYFILSLKKNC